MKNKIFTFGIIFLLIVSLTVVAYAGLFDRFRKTNCQSGQVLVNGKCISLELEQRRWDITSVLSVTDNNPVDYDLSRSRLDTLIISNLQTGHILNNYGPGSGPYSENYLIRLMAIKSIGHNAIVDIVVKGSKGLERKVIYGDTSATFNSVGSRPIQVRAEDIFNEDGITNDRATIIVGF